MKWRNLHIAAWVGLVLVVAGAGNARAALISWGAATNVGGDSDVSTQGTSFAAANPGGNSSGVAATTTVNGVTFGGWLPAGATPQTDPSGHFTLTPAPGHSVQAASVFGSSSAPFSGLSSAYQVLLSYADFAQSLTNANDFTGGLTLTISGLSVGSTYLFQWWINDSRPFATGPVIATTGANSVSLDPNTTNAAGGTGQFAIGTFVADAPTQIINFTTTGNANGQSAFQVRTLAVPEPGAGCLLVAGFAGMGLLRRRRAGRREGDSH